MIPPDLKGIGTAWDRDDWIELAGTIFGGIILSGGFWLIAIMFMAI